MAVNPVRIIQACIALLALGLAFWLGGQGARADFADYKTKMAEKTAQVAEAATKASELARKQEQAIATKQTEAGDTASTREDKIHADYDERIAAAVAGRDSELGRVRKLWGQCETSRLSGGAAIAAEAAEENRLRDASAARIVRAVQLAQSERDEAIDRYEAVRLGQAVTVKDRAGP